VRHKSSKKYIFITGGVTSSLGKGLAAASIAALLERRGINVSMLKMDPYINVDPGTMSPFQHGEVFVTDDGAETDLDLGHYERFTSLTLSKKSNFTTGQVYLKVIENEREGNYLGKTVQVVPHITDEIKKRIHLAAEGTDLLLAEIGGTVGDIESLPFLESIRQFGNDVGRENVLFVHLVLIPYLSAAGELKTKPAQHSVRELRSIGLFPNIIICRSEKIIDESVLEKLELFCNVSKSQIFQSNDLATIYKVPLEFHKQQMDDKITEILGIWAPSPKMDELEKVVHNFENPIQSIRIGIVGKYTDLTESYKSLNEALNHGSIWNQAQLELVYIDADDLVDDEKLQEKMESIHGVLVPGGFGERGTEGKIRAISHVRKNKIPFLGICLGMQLAIVEFAKNIKGLEDAASEEFSKGGSFVIQYMKGQSKYGSKGGSMRLGAYECSLNNGTLTRKIYGEEKIFERHRHRLEVNNEYLEKIKQEGMVISGVNEQLNLVEVIELENHPFFIGCQYHPEFKSRPFSPHPLFRSFIQASLNYKKRV
jgi:CTP synthase